MMSPLQGRTLPTLVCGWRETEELDEEVVVVELEVELHVELLELVECETELEEELEELEEELDEELDEEELEAPSSSSIATYHHR